VTGEGGVRLLQTGRLKVRTALVPEHEGNSDALTFPSLPVGPVSTGVSAGAARIRLPAKWSY